MLDNQEEKQIKVYFSYCREDAIRENIYKISEEMKKFGIIIKYDMCDNPSNISRYINDEMLDADFIAIMIGPEYINRANKKLQDGSKRTYVEIEFDEIIRRKQCNNSSLLPIITMSQNREVILPKALAENRYFDLRTDYENNVKKLLKYILERKEKNVENADLAEEKSNQSKDFSIKLCFDENIPRLSGILKNEYVEIHLSHNEVIDLFLDDYVSFDKRENVIQIKNRFCISVTETMYLDYSKQKKVYQERFLEKIHEYEAKYEVEKCYLSKNGYMYEVAKVSKKLWNSMIKFANEHDWNNDSSEMNIFQFNQYYIHVFEPVISNSDKLNSGEHAIFRAYKDDNFEYDNVVVYIDIRDFFSSGFEPKINFRDRWGVETASEWLCKEFIPQVCEHYNLENDSEYSFYHCVEEKDIFSEMQIFYMENRVKVLRTEIDALIESLAFCLNKHYPQNDFNYICTKLNISSCKLMGNAQQVARIIAEYIKSDKFNQRKNEYDNSSLADDLLRCIRVFTDSFSSVKLSPKQYEYICMKCSTLIDKMNRIKVFQKYRFFYQC